ncbi:nucleotidyltransferase domain-containing protein [Mesobacillus foraminis]|nr:nucleotidyltransferase domain-containing protein [Mesobacillus foraminis]
MERDQSLPKHRDILLEKALQDLTADPDVLAIYLAGSLARGNDDVYSDIDLHTVVNPEKIEGFIKDKSNRAKKWGKVLFEESQLYTPWIVTHYDCFVKVDSWYHSPGEVTPSIWLKGNKVLYDPHHILSNVMKESSHLVYSPSPEEVEAWKNKVLAFIHETYRAVMRDEMYYALSNMDRVRWLVVYGWYMEMEQHLDCPYGGWSKIEGKRSKLKAGQLTLLESWESSRNSHEIMETMARVAAEFLRLNQSLSRKVNIKENEKYIKKIIEMVI